MGRFFQHRRFRTRPIALWLIVLISPLARGQAVIPETQDLAQLQTRFQSIADRVAPAVVAISASTSQEVSPSALRSEEMNPQKLDTILSKTTRIIGTGFIITNDGYILTNDHVIDEAGQLWVTTDDKKVYPALVVGSDPRADLAVLKIPGRNLAAVHFGDAANLKRGQWSLAIGNPYGLSAQGQMSLSVGVISAVNRSLQKLSDRENRLYLNLIQTTAQINPGNSGGPLFNLNGDVIGVNTAVIMPQKTTNGIGFALPIDAHLLGIVNDLKQGREIVYAYLGVVAANPTDRQRRDAGLSDFVGARVESVEADSPAAGRLRDDDFLLSLDGHPIADSDHFVEIVGAAPVNHPIRIDILRSGQPLTLSLTLTKRPLPVAAVTRDSQRLRWGGMLLGPLPPENPVGGTAGLMVFGIDPTSPFNKLGIQSGTVIQSVAGKPVTDVTQLQAIINDVPLEQCDIGVAASTASAHAALPIEP